MRVLRRPEVAAACGDRAVEKLVLGDPLPVGIGGVEKRTDPQPLVDTDALIRDRDRRPCIDGREREGVPIAPVGAVERANPYRLGTAGLPAANPDAGEI